MNPGAHSPGRQDRTYPLVLAAGGELPDALVHAAADLIEHYGFPPVGDGPDLEALRALLHRFVYGW